MSLHWVQAFLEAQAAELDAARNTQLAYARDLRDYGDWLTRRGSDYALATRADIEAYLVDCDAQGLAKSTRRGRFGPSNNCTGLL